MVRESMRNDNSEDVTSSETEGNIREGGSDGLGKLKNGECVLGDFRILRKIGSGGMGEVYEAEQVSLKRKVALKVLPSHLSFSDVTVKRFKREAEAGGRQRHPGIVAIYAVGEHEGYHYIAQELVEEGRSVSDRLAELRKTKKLPIGYFREVADIVANTADALQHAHKSKVIHRDVKPSNILLKPDGAPKVSDFGLAKVEGALALSSTGDFAGTPYYMSPEQAMARRMGIDHRTDIYSTGATLYEMLSLERPFKGKTSHEVFQKIMLQEPVDPRKLNPRVPRDLSVICLKAMEKNPDHRYQTMKEFAADLNRFLSGDVIQAKLSGPGTRLLKWVKRNHKLTTTMSITMLIVVMVVGLFAFYVNMKSTATGMEEAFEAGDIRGFFSKLDSFTLSYGWGMRNRSHGA